MANDRFPYKTANTLDQALLDKCINNTTIELNMIAEIETPTGTIYASDRNIYVGSTFYQALTQFPTIERKLSDWLSPVPEFSTLELEITNADGRFNDLLPGGANYASWVGNQVVVKLGLRDVAGSYIIIYKGEVTELGGVARKAYSFVLTSRDVTASLDVDLPKKRFSTGDYANLDDELIGMPMPIFYGDWDTTADLPTYTTDTNGTIGTGAVGVKGYPVNGKAALGTPATAVQVIFTSQQALTITTSANVYLNRGGVLYTIATADIGSVTSSGFSVTQNSGNTTIGGVNYQYEKGDLFFARITSGAMNHNPVAHAKALMEDFLGISAGDFHTNWTTFAARFAVGSGNTEEAASRVALYEQESGLTYAQSLLAQVQLQLFVDLAAKFKLHSNAFQDFAITSTNTAIKQIDVVKDTLEVRLRDSYNFNRCNAAFALHPYPGNELFLTAVYKNAASIAAMGKEVSNTIPFPNLYKRVQVEYHLKEILKLASAVFEEVRCDLTWRHILQDLSNTTLLFATVSQLSFSNVPAFFRKIGYNPEGFKLEAALWSLQLVSFPSYTPAAGSTGGYDATITQET